MGSHSPMVLFKADVKKHNTYMTLLFCLYSESPNNSLSLYFLKKKSFIEEIVLNVQPWKTTTVRVNMFISLMLTKAALI